MCVSTVAADSKAPEKTRAFFALAISPSCKVPAEPNLLALLRPAGPQQVLTAPAPDGTSEQCAVRAMGGVFCFVLLSCSARAVSPAQGRSVFSFAVWSISRSVAELLHRSIWLLSVVLGS